MKYGPPVSGPGGTPGGDRFDGAPDLLVGEIATIRTFDLQADGTLWGLMHFGRAWVAGVNTAVCARHARAGARGCRCGFWSYGHRSGIAEQPASRTVTAVVDNWGRITPGTRGIRAEHAAIRALCLGPRVSDRLAGRVADRYPGVMIYRDENAMLAAHPLTDLDVFDRTPPVVGRPTGRRRAGVPALVAILALAVIGTMFSHDLHSDRSGHPLVFAAVFLLGYALIRTRAAVAAGARSEVGGELLSPARTVAQVNAGLLTVLLFATFAFPGSPATSVALLLVLTGGRALVRRFFPGSVPVRSTPGGLILRATSPRYRRALVA